MNDTSSCLFSLLRTNLVEVVVFAFPRDELNYYSTHTHAQLIIGTSVTFTDRFMTLIVCITIQLLDITQPER